MMMKSLHWNPTLQCSSLINNTGIFKKTKKSEQAFPKQELPETCVGTKLPNKDP